MAASSSRSAGCTDWAAGMQWRGDQAAARRILGKQLVGAGKVHRTDVEVASEDRIIDWADVVDGDDCIHDAVGVRVFVDHLVEPIVLLGVVGIDADDEQALLGWRQDR